MDKIISFIVVVLCISSLLMPGLVITAIWIDWSPILDKILQTNIVVLVTSLFVSVILVSQ